VNTWTCPECNVEIIEPRRRGPHLSGCRRKSRAQFIYDDATDPQHKHPLELRKCELCTKDFLARRDNKYVGRFCSKTCAQLGENNSNKKNTSIRKTPVIPSYYTLHRHLYETKGSAKEYRCFCGERAQAWANLTGQYEDLEDYTPMCGRCHNRYDKGRSMMGDTEGWAEYLKKRECTS